MAASEEGFREIVTTTTIWEGGFSTYEFLRKNDHDRAPSEPVRISEHNFPIWSYVLYYVFLRYIFYGAPMQFHLPPSVDRLCRDIGITTVVLILA